MFLVKPVFDPPGIWLHSAVHTLAFDVIEFLTSTFLIKNVSSSTVLDRELFRSLRKLC